MSTGHPRELLGESSRERPVAESLADAVYAAVHGGALSPKGLASEVGVRVGYLLDAANPDHTTQLQTRLVIPITNRSRRDDIIRFLSDGCGGVFFRLRPVSAALDASTAAVLREVADYLHSVTEGERDGSFSAADFERTRRQIREAITALLCAG